MTTHTLNVSREGVIRTLRNQFTRSSTFLSEALQNARRAGASEVRVQWSPDYRVMTIADDGSGIQDFEALFTLGRSGWDAAVIAEENPFGVGFMAAVLASERVAIRSRDREVNFNTRDLLNFVPVEVLHTKHPQRNGTVLSLTLHAETCQTIHAVPHLDAKTSIERWQTLLAQMVLGFPIPVYFNDQALPRPHALNSGLTYFETEVGYIYMDTWEACQPRNHREPPTLYCQGLPIHRHRSPIDRSPDILHLNHHRFRVRMPDRDVLIDAEKEFERIGEATRALWRKRLVETFSALDRQTFVDRHWKLCVELGLAELLRDGPVTASMLQYYGKPVELIDSYDKAKVEWGTQSLPGRAALFIEDLDGDYGGIHGDPPAPLASIYAMQRSMPVLNSHVPACHWARQRMVDLLDPDLGIRYRLNGPTRSAHYSGEWISCDVLVCESYTIEFVPTASCDVPAKLRANLTPLIVTDVALYDADEKCIVVPAGVEWAGVAVAQVSAYHDEFEQFRDSEYERDQQGVATLAEVLRNDSPQAYLEALLRNVRLDPELLGAGSYLVRYDASQERLVVSMP